MFSLFGVFFLMDNMEEAEVRWLCNKWYANAWDLRYHCGKQQDKHNSFNLDNSSENKEEKLVWRLVKTKTS